MREDDQQGPLAGILLSSPTPGVDGRVREQQPPLSLRLLRLPRLRPAPEPAEQRLRHVEHLPAGRGREQSRLAEQPHQLLLRLAVLVGGTGLAVLVVDLHAGVGGAPREPDPQLGRLDLFVGEQSAEVKGCDPASLAVGQT